MFSMDWAEKSEEEGNGGVTSIFAGPGQAPAMYWPPLHAVAVFWQTPDPDGVLQVVFGTQHL